MLMRLATHSNRTSQSLEYSHLLSHFHIRSIKARLAHRDLTFIHSVYSGRIKSEGIMGMFELHVPAIDGLEDMRFYMSPTQGSRR